MSENEGIRPAVRLHESLQGQLRCEVLWVDSIRVNESDEAYQALCEQAAEFASRWADTRPGQIPGTAEARTLYKAFGVDPTRTRPSSEALLRRALKGQDLYRINNVVDLGNLISLRWLLPLGLYDLDHVQGEGVWIRVGEAGAAYEGIRKGEVHLEGRLTVADELGPFGSPTSDSFRSRIREQTCRALAILFAPVGGDPARLHEAGGDLAAAFERYAQGTVLQRMHLEED